mgnify:FL=1|jgi:hypothetical protein
MGLVTDIQAVLNPLASGGAWYGINTTEPPVYPFIVWQRVVSTTNNTLRGASDLQNTRVQIDIFSRSVSESVSIEDAVESAMASASFTNLLVSSQDIYESEVKAFRITKDYSVWATN